MSSDIRDANVAIIAFGMTECPACENYMPRLERITQQAGAPFFIYQKGLEISPDKIPVLMLNVASQDSTIQSLANDLEVESVPASFVFIFKKRKPVDVVRAEGSLSDQQIGAMLSIARSKL